MVVVHRAPNLQLPTRSGVDGATWLLCWASLIPVPYGRRERAPGYIVVVTSAGTVGSSLI